MIPGAPFANLYNINTTTGAATNPRSTGLNSLVGIAFSPSGTTLYGLTGQGATPGALFTIDRTTGASSLIGSTGLANIVEGDIAFDPTSGFLYGIQATGPALILRQLFTLNLTNGTGTIVGNIPSNDPGNNSDLSAMTFDSAGNLFVLDTGLGHENLLRVNKATAGIITSTPLSVALGNVAGLAFDPDNGMFFAADGGGGGTRNLYTLNTSTGTLTLVGPTGTPDGLAGLTFGPSGPAAAIPEPSALALLGLGIAALAGRRWRRAAGRGARANRRRDMAP
jgi:DNA-binding beta-propeller fold protein YncE